MSGFSINTVTVSGNLTRDPELRNLPSGTSVCSLGIAHNERWKNKQTDAWEDRAHFFNVTVWGGVGEWVAKNLSKGTPVVVSGRLAFRSWEAQDGSKRSAVDITADNIVSMRESNGGGGGGGYTPRSDIPVDNGAAAPTPVASAPPGGDDDIPF